MSQFTYSRAHRALLTTTSDARGAVAAIGDLRAELLYRLEMAYQLIADLSEDRRGDLVLLRRIASARSVAEARRLAQARLDDLR